MVMEKEILLRINIVTMEKLVELSQEPEFNGNKSQVIRSAIHYYYNKKIGKQKVKKDENNKCN